MISFCERIYLQKGIIFTNLIHNKKTARESWKKGGNMLQQQDADDSNKIMGLEPKQLIIGVIVSVIVLGIAVFGSLELAVQIGGVLMMVGGVFMLIQKDMKGIGLIVSGFLVWRFLATIVGGGEGFVGGVMSSISDCSECKEYFDDDGNETPYKLYTTKVEEYSERSWLYQVFTFDPTFDDAVKEWRAVYKKCTKLAKKNAVDMNIPFTESQLEVSKCPGLPSQLEELSKYATGKLQEPDEDTTDKTEESNDESDAPKKGKGGKIKGPKTSDGDDDGDPAPTQEKKQKKRVETPQADPQPTKEEKKPATGKSRYGGN